MAFKKKEHPKEKPNLHPRNRHRERYDFKSLIASCIELAPYVKVNEYGDESIDFFNPQAVRILNKALLKHTYHVDHWDIPKNYLCPPVPGRADYIHYVADLLAADNNNAVPYGKKVLCLDIGIGANAIYPIIGASQYEWSFIGADIDPVAIESAQRIISMNPTLRERVVLRLQTDPKRIFKEVISEDEFFDLTVCNPPFHASADEARDGTLRKLSNLKRKKVMKADLNFGGKSSELWCEGGEERFVGDMIRESNLFRSSCLWFTTLVAKSFHLDKLVADIKVAGAAEVKVIPMSQGNKSSRIVAWTYFTGDDRRMLATTRWCD